MKRKILKWSGIIVLTIILLFGITLSILYSKQDEIVQDLLQKSNADFVAQVDIQESHISLFENFPYISIDLENLHVRENKSDTAQTIMYLQEVYIGFDLWTIISGKMEIKRIKLKNGRIDIIQYADGEFNITRAFESTKEIEDPEEEFHLDLQSIILENVDFTKLNVENNLLVDVHFTETRSSFKSKAGHLFMALDSKFELSLILDKDTTFINHKHFELDTDFEYSPETDLFVIKPTTAKLEGAVFDMEGSIDFKREVFLDLKFSGNKPNFDLFLAMAPEELMPTLKKYDNKGKIFFETTIQGSCINHHTPAINARFGCEDAFFTNTEVDKKVDDLNFSGYFTNGSSRNPSTMEFGIKDFSARPEVGQFTGNLVVKNFESPDINLQLNSDFELNFLAKFFNLTDLYDLSGKVQLTMNFKDIIDLRNPEKTIEKFNESYFSQLKIENLSFGKESTDLPIKDIDLYAEMDGHEAKISYCNIEIGGSSISLHGSISDLPAIIHHTDQPVTAKLDISSKQLDLFELTGSDTLTSINEQIKNLSLGLHFVSSARAFTESPNLPIGEFYVDSLTAQLTHYPHTLHDFHADVIIEKEDFKVIDFKGFIDKSDFHFSGKLKHYDLWFAEHPKGDTHIEFNLTSRMLQLHDIFSYQGENYVPEDYRHEEFDQLKIQGSTDLHFNEGMQSIDLRIDKFDTKMKIHAMRFENFKGRVHYEKDHLVVEDFSGKLGHSDIHTSLHYYLGDDEAQKKRENKFELRSARLDFDQIFQYHLPTTTDSLSANTNYHDEGFNIYDLPFTDMTFDVKIDHLNYHKYLIHEVDAQIRTTPEHYLYVDKLKLQAADGYFDIKGYFNGSDPSKIYFSPDMTITKVDLDKLLLKFDNFGQDHLVSENLHGKLSGKLTGQIRMHKDLVPVIHESEIHMDIEVLEGRLENYAMLEAMSDYFKDKNIQRVSFDTLSNHIDLKKGILTIPNMTINSTLGFMQISGSQDMDMNMDYFVRIPWKLVTQAASSKLFGKKVEEIDPEQEHAIQYEDKEKRIRYLNIRITGNTENYNITLEKEKKKK
jgi:hypothetical protein